MNGARPAPPDEPERLVRGSASLGGTSAHGVIDCIDLATVEGRARLDDEGLWFVVLDFDGRGRAWRFAERADGRAMGLHLTSTGADMMRQAEQTAAELEIDKTAKLSKEERKTLLQLLKKVYK